MTKRTWESQMDSDRLPLSALGHRRLTNDIASANPGLLMRHLSVQSHRGHVLEDDVTEGTLLHVTQVGEVELDVLVGGGDVSAQTARLLESGVEWTRGWLNEALSWHKSLEKSQVPSGPPRTPFRLELLIVL